MSPNATQLFVDAMRLPANDRADLAARLIDSLEEVAEEEASLAWEVEVQRRVQELIDGRVATVPWTEVRRQMVEAIDARRDR